jgi:cAMP phosphodiesterase
VRAAKAWVTGVRRRGHAKLEEYARARRGARRDGSFASVAWCAWCALRALRAALAQTKVMELRVIGCHGGETPRHRTSAFVIDDRLAIDAGSLTSGMDLKAQFRLNACIISHAHLDHIRDLATIADNRCQADCEPLVVAATKETLHVLKKHFFNNLIWPDFSQIPNKAKPTIQYVELKPEKRVAIAGYQVRSVTVNHTIDSSGFIVEGKDATIAYSGDTGPTDRFWELLNEEPNLKALLMEVSFPNREQKLATVSGHHTPRTLLKDLKKYAKPQDLPTLLYHIKPVFQAEVEQEVARLKGVNLTVTALNDQYVL